MCALMALTEGTRNDLVSVGIIECDGVHDVSVAFQGQQFVTSNCVPYFASTIITASNELVAGLVECAIRQWQDVCSQDLEQEEVPSLDTLLLLD